MRGYKQMYDQHLKKHFGNLTLQQYQPIMGTRFLQSLTGTQSRVTLVHIKSLGQSIFKLALREERVTANPFDDVHIPEDAVQSKPTGHYTIAEAEAIISALVDHVDAQLVMSLTCFLALRPGEIQGLRWEDFDEENVYIRRSIVRGVVGTPKTRESEAALPLLDRVRVPLELYRQKCDTSLGWLFPSPLSTMVRNVIRPTLKAAGIEWKGMYSGRRGAITELINRSGNVALGQALARHTNMNTTLQFYKKQMSTSALREGMKLLEGE